MTIVTELDRKQRRELNWCIVGIVAAAIAFGVIMAMFDTSTFGPMVCGGLLIIDIVVFTACFLRFESITSRSSYCPDEPEEKSKY